jgi:hypothetical protein
MELVFRPKKIAKALGILISLLILANIAGFIARYYFGITSSYVVQFFNMAEEHNIPTFFSSLQLGLCGFILGIITLVRKKQGAKDYWYWLGLSVIFMFLALDEAIEIHERIALFVRSTLNTTGIFYFAWSIPYGLFILAFMTAYIPFLWRLPAPTKKLMILSGIIFVGGALGMEALESLYHTETGQKGFYFNIMTTLEESMEMAGILLFLYSLLQYIDLHLGGITLSLSSKKKVAMPPAAARTSFQENSRNNVPSKVQLAN